MRLEYRCVGEGKIESGEGVRCSVQRSWLQHSRVRRQHHEIASSRRMSLTATSESAQTYMASPAHVRRIKGCHV